MEIEQSRIDDLAERVKLVHEKGFTVKTGITLSAYNEAGYGYVIELTTEEFRDDETLNLALLRLEQLIKTPRHRADTNQWPTSRQRR